MTLYENAHALTINIYKPNTPLVLDLFLLPCITGIALKTHKGVVDSDRIEDICIIPLYI